MSDSVRASAAKPLPLSAYLGRLSKGLSKYLEDNEVGDAQIFEELFRDRVRFDHSTKKWYVWEADRWAEDKKGKVYTAVQRVAAVYELAAEEINDPECPEFDALVRRHRALLTSRRMHDVLKIASHFPSVALIGDEWNINPLSLPVANGVVDLTTGTLRKAMPSEYVNIHAPTEWLGLDCPAPEWEKFIAGICNGDEALMTFLQRLLGYAITGDTREQVMPIFYGQGSNGKSTLMDVVAAVLGDAFCISTQSASLMDIRASDGGAAQPFVFGLRNKRIAFASESREGQKLDTGLVKQLTGDHNITARTLYGQPLSFRSTHKIVLVTNNLPSLPDGSDYALERRLIIFPFEACFVDHPTLPHQQPRDKDLLPKLANEAPGILAWLVRGTLAWLEQELNPPSACRIATERYRMEEDWFGQFVSDEVGEGPDLEVPVGSLYEAYFSWCKRTGRAPVPLETFGKKATQRFGPAKAKTIRGKTTKVYRGIALATSGH